MTHEAFTNHLEREIAQNPNANIRKLLQAAISVHEEYDFYTPPLLDDLNNISRDFENNFLAIARRGRERYLENVKTMGAEAAYQEAAKGLLGEFISLQR